MALFALYKRPKSNNKAMAGLTDDQRAVYDRQLRVWGVEVQNRLNNAKVLVIGGDGLAAEIAKNIVLAGVGHVAVGDDSPCAQAIPGNFLVPADADPASTVAHACQKTLSAMNPLITVSSQPLESMGTDLQGLLAPYDTVISTQGLGLGARALEDACAAAGKQLFVAELRGSLSYAYIHLGKHSFSEKAKQQEAAAGAGAKADGSAAAAGGPVEKEFQYPRMEAALGRPVSQCLGRRPPHALYQVLRAVEVFEVAKGRRPGPGDVEELADAAAKLESIEGAPKGSISRDLLTAYAEGSASDLSAGPVAAVVGGVVANTVIRAISHWGAPLKNFFFFSLHDGQGLVEDMVG